MPGQVLLLLGLPGAGKSTVGPLVAARLGRPFVDLDSRIEEMAGMPIPTIFAREGEAGFRARESAATRALSGEMVLAPGGGWVEDGRNLEALGGGVTSVYLRVSIEVALVRLGRSPLVRPLLEGPDPHSAMKKLLERREARYLQADHTVSVDSMRPDEVALSIVALVSGSGGD